MFAIFPNKTDPAIYFAQGMDVRSASLRSLRRRSGICQDWTRRAGRLRRMFSLENFQTVKTGSTISTNRYMIKSTLKIARCCALVIQSFSNFLGLFQVIMANLGFQGNEGPTVGIFFDPKKCFINLERSLVSTGREPHLKFRCSFWKKRNASGPLWRCMMMYVNTLMSFCCWFAWICCGEVCEKHICRFQNL